MRERRAFLSWLIRIPGVALLGGAASASAAACDDGGGDASGRRDALADAAGDGGAPDGMVDGDGAPDGVLDGDGGASDSDAEPMVCEPTGEDLQGPFYEPDAPSTASLAPAGEPGVPLAIAGLVFGPDCETPLPGATVEVWQADDAGDYHDDKLRATLAADADGGYTFDTIRPGRYLQASGYRPAHIHYKVSAPGHRTLITQLYFEGDPFLAPEDSCGVCGSEDEGRIIPLAEGPGGALSGTFDVVLAAV
ncbi:MAG: hypothetical protein ACQEXJ_15415 [Myxococcota bacterium]